MLRCAIRLDGKAYSAQISSQSIPANINDVFLIGVHREFRGLWQNKQQALEQKLTLAAQHRKASSVLPKRWRQAFSVSSTLSITSSGWIIVAVRKEDYLEVKNVLALLSVSQFFFEKDCCSVLFQLMRQDWNANFPFFMLPTPQRPPSFSVSSHDYKWKNNLITASK